MICFLLFSKARNPGEHSIVAFVLVHFWSDHALGAKICWCSHFLFLQKALKFHDENLQFAQKYVFRLFCEDPDFIKDILKETWCSPDLQKILSRQWSANDKKWKWEQKREKILKVSSKNWRRKKESDISKYDIFSQWSEFNLTWLKMVVLSKWQIWSKKALKNLKASVTAFWLPSIVGHNLNWKQFSFQAIIQSKSQSAITHANPKSSLLYSLCKCVHRRTHFDKKEWVFKHRRQYLYVQCHL